MAEQTTTEAREHARDVLSQLVIDINAGGKGGYNIVVGETYRAIGQQPTGWEAKATTYVEVRTATQQIARLFLDENGDLSNVVIASGVEWSVVPRFLRKIAA